MTTAKWKTSHREFAVRILDTYRTTEGFKHLRLHDDPNEFDLATLTPEGTAILAHIIEQHRCGPVCKPSCSVLYLVWVIEGCPNGHESVEEALLHNSVEIVPSEARP